MFAEAPSRGYLIENTFMACARLHRSLAIPPPLQMAARAAGPAKLLPLVLSQQRWFDGPLGFERIRRHRRPACKCALYLAIAGPGCQRAGSFTGHDEAVVSP